MIWPIILIITIWLHFANKGAGVFFTQERPGKNEKIFRVIKFKSMTDERGANGKLLPDAQRLTKVGRFIRSTSLDELPQLFNVLMGDMALIGPRPLTSAYLPFYDKEQARRHEVRPGITGWAQVNGRNHQKLSKKFEMDVWYVDHLSLLLDIKILYMTVVNVINRKDVGIGSGDMREVDDLHILERIIARKEALMVKEIGSNFDLSPDINLDSEEPIDLDLYNIKGEDTTFLSTGRSCISYILDDIEFYNPNIIKNALIPPFTCHTVIEPFIKKGYKISAYSIDQSLNINISRFRDEILNSEANVVLVHRYFGFDTLVGFNEIIKEFSEKGVVFIEDKTQCLYSSHPQINADYIVGSFRKWAALPDGGYAIKNVGQFIDKPEDYDNELMQRKLHAALLKYQYIHHHKGNKDVFLAEFRAAEDKLIDQDKYYAISPASSSIQVKMDKKSLKEKRRENYSYVYEFLNRIPNIKIITPKLSEFDVPLYIALSCKDRNSLQAYLRDAYIYAPIVWPKAEQCPTVCGDVDYIYNTVLCLPIDQRYDISDMERMVKKIEEYENRR